MKITFKIGLLIFFLIAALVAINPSGYFYSGVLVKSVTPNSIAAEAGISKGEIIKSINDYKINSIDDYTKVISRLSDNLKPINWTIEASGKKFEYSNPILDFDVDENLTIIKVGKVALLAGIEENLTLEKINNELINDIEKFNTIKTKLEPKIKLRIITNKGDYTFYTSSIDFTVSPIPKTNLKAGLDLQGGAKALVKPERKLSSTEMADLIQVTQNRLNTYGVADVSVRSASDLSGNNYMVVEVAGVSPKELEELIAQQGKFEAKIGNETVFVGGRKDITSVCRNDASCSGVRECRQTIEGYYCSFEFVIYLSEEAAKRQANITSTLQENLTPSGERILSKNLDLILDDKQVDTLQIDADLKGKVATQIAIRGPGIGKTQQEAYQAAEANMKKLQTILITGSLPFKLEIVKLDNISPLLGKEFVNNLFYVTFAVIIAVALVIFIKYRKMVYTLPIMLTICSEIFILLGFASLIRWNLDLASIAGIIAAIGTGVDQQIIIVDESQFKKIQYSMKEKIKRAFSIIFGAFSTTVVAMIPLWWAGAGMMKGFALTTIAGICIGVLITRPAFSDIIKQIIKE
ncbi:MAG: site-2 protease family protein [Candidatus Pacearchaeota archaeon]